MPKRKVFRKKNGEAHVFDESDCGSIPSEEGPTVRFREPEVPTSKNQLEDPVVEKSSVSVMPQPPSFIRPLPPAAISRRKSDPVARYHGYRHFWSTFRVPGEDNRDRLRWNLRVTLSQEDSPKRNKVYIDFVIGATSTPRSTSVHCMYELLTRFDCVIWILF
jgi:hypothetical protein